MSAILDMGIYPFVGDSGRYFVRSGKTPTLYLVDLDHCADADDAYSVHAACGCMDFQIRSGMMLRPAPPCKHIRAVVKYQALQQKLGGLRR